MTFRRRKKQTALAGFLSIIIAFAAYFAIQKIILKRRIETSTKAFADWKHLKPIDHEEITIIREKEKGKWANRNDVRLEKDLVFLDNKGEDENYLFNRLGNVYTDKAGNVYIGDYSPRCQAPAWLRTSLPL